MTDHQISKYLEVIKAFNDHGVEYVVIGGVAVIIHGLPRVTQDLDILIKLTSGNLASLKNALNRVFNDPEIEQINFGDLEKYAVVRYGSPDNFHIDIMVRIGNTVDFESIHTEEKEIEGIKVVIANAESLFELKKNTIRPEDKRDAFFLKKLIDGKLKRKNNAGL